MRKIVFVNNKGGVGKTTLALMTACALQDAGYKVAIEDRDPNKSITGWAKRVGCVPLLKEAPSAELIVVDTASSAVDYGRLRSRSNARMVEIIGEATRVVLVAETAMIGIEASIQMAALIKEYAPEKGKLIFNRVRRATEIGRRDLAEMAAMIGLPNVACSLPENESFRRAAEYGWQAVPRKDQLVVMNAVMQILL